MLLQGHIQSTSDRVQLNDLQSLLCATLQVCRLFFEIFMYCCFVYVNHSILCKVIYADDSCYVHILILNGLLCAVRKFVAFC